MGMTSRIARMMGRLTAGTLAAALTWLGGEQAASAQEILLTGPLAGAPAVRQLKLYREGRFEVSPAVSFTLLDEYQRQIILGARINYNFTDWLAVGLWGGSGALKFPTQLAEDIESTNTKRIAADRAAGRASLNSQLTAKNVGSKFTAQLGTMDWVLAPQVTLVPFRGKIALFQSIFSDTDLYFFGGPAIVGVKERADCAPTPTTDCTQNFAMQSRIAIAPTFGLGFSFYVNQWNAFGFEWRGLPFSRNVGGFDNRGRDPDARFPDEKVNAEDQEFKFNQMLTLTWGFYFPTEYRLSE